MYSQHPAAPPGWVADFEIVRPLGRSRSFLLARAPARLGAAGPEVVLKVYPAQAAGEPGGMQRVSLALRQLAAVRSPYLVRLLEVGRNDGVIYYAMERLPGGSLAEPASRLTFAQVLRAVAHAARGAHELHEHGIVHQNIHPGAVILHPEGASLSDPGLATFLHPGMTPTGPLEQPSLAFVSPDVLRGQQPARTSDLYSLAATLHAAASGQTLYPRLDDSDPAAARAEICASPPTVASGLPGPVEQIVRECIEPAHPNRPKTARDLAERLDAVWKH